MYSASVGAPPDPFARAGQNWNLPPPIPDALLEGGCAAFRRLLAANMRHAGALRIDEIGLAAVVGADQVAVGGAHRAAVAVQQHQPQLQRDRALGPLPMFEDALRRPAAWLVERLSQPGRSALEWIGLRASVNMGISASDDRADP